MSIAAERHRQAMDFAERAFLARIQGQSAEAMRLFKEAFQAELAAIKCLPTSDSDEPNYSVLHRSAATLALDCGDPETAEKLAAAALAHSPPAEIAEELRDLLEQVYFLRHLRVRGVTLAEDEMQMSLAGRGVGYGVVPSDEFMVRVSTTSKAFYRIVERRSGRPFRESGPVGKGLTAQYELFVSVPRAASFAITLKLGQPRAVHTLLKPHPKHETWARRKPSECLYLITRPAEVSGTHCGL